MIGRLGSRFRRELARLGVRLIKWSGTYDGYFGSWRWGVFDFAERRGLHVLPVHYYSPVPDLSRTHAPDDARRFLAADEATLDAGVRMLEGFRARFATEFDEIAARQDEGSPVRFQFGAAPYAGVEAEALYGIIRTRKPARIVEIGCGHTTLLISEAIARENASGYAPDYTCVEPYRPAYLEDLPVQVTRFIDKPLQEVPLDLFRELGRGDILFIDSSHVVAFGSDTIHELLEILPNLASGVLVHVHDIFLPYEYPWDWLKKSRYFWTEQYLLDALLRGAPRYRVLLPLYQLHRERSAEVSALFPAGGGPAHGPSAYWIEIAGDG